MSHRNAVPYLEAVPYAMLGCVSKQFNVRQFDKVLWVRLCDEVTDEFDMLSIKNMASSKILILDASRYDYKIGSHWFGIVPTELDLSIGYHEYELVFKNRYTDVILPIYFGYRIQDDNPDTSDYIYMKRVNE